MRLIAATVLLALVALIATAKLAKPQTVSAMPGCRLIEPMVERIIASAGGEAVRRADFTGAEALRLIEAINAEPPESSFAGTHLVLLERDGYPSLVGVADDHGCFMGGAQLSHEVVERLFGGAIVTDAELDAVIVRAAHDGARAALHEIGLCDAGAASDVRELRSLLDAYRLAKRTVAHTTIQVVTVAVLGAVLAWVGLHAHWID